MRELLKLTPEYATVIENGIEKKVPLYSLQLNAVIRIRPGEKVPADAVVVHGSSFVDEAMLSGEELPVSKVPGSRIYGGTVNAGVSDGMGDCVYIADGATFVVEGGEFLGGDVYIKTVGEKAIVLSGHVTMDELDLTSGGIIAFGKDGVIGGSVKVNANQGPFTDSDYLYAESSMPFFAGSKEGMYIILNDHTLHFAKANAIPGDFTGDGTANNDDVVLLLWHVLFPEEYPLEMNADLTGDGCINNDDVVLLLWHVLFPEEYPL